MALDFPNSPSPGSTFQSGTRSWQYDGNTWVSTSSVGYTGSAGLVVTTTNTITSNNNITPVFSGYSSQYDVTALAVSANILTPSGTGVTNGYKLLLRIKDNGTARSLTWTTTSGGYRAVGVILPGATVASNVMYAGCVYNAQDTYWDVIAIAQQSV